MASISRATRVKAAELAAQCLQGQCNDGEIGARLASLVVFFECYIATGISATDERMHLLGKRRLKRLKVISGGKLS